MISIVGYDDQYAKDFRSLNEAWLVRFFRIEPIDAAILAAPREKIVEPGGQVFFAVEAGNALGTCALKRSGDADFELTKMAVTESAQGRGLGRLLMQAACEWFVAHDGRLLFLESHSTLEAALGLYRAFGFVEKPRPFSSDYERSDVYMEWQGPNSVGTP